jgi:hypothetical protein
MAYDPGHSLVQSMKTVNPLVGQLFRRVWLLVFLQPCARSAPVTGDVTGSDAGASIETATLEVIVNDADSLSRRTTGACYAQQRHIPEKI